MSSTQSHFDFASFYHLSPDLESLGTLGTTSDHETARTSSTPPTTSTAEQQQLVADSYSTSIQTTTLPPTFAAVNLKASSIPQKVTDYISARLSIQRLFIQSSNWSQYFATWPESSQLPQFYEPPPYIPGIYSGTYLEYGPQGTAIPTYNNPFSSAGLPSQDGHGDVLNYSGDYNTPPLFPQGCTSFASTPLGYPIPICDTPILSSQPQTSRSVVPDSDFLGSGTSGPGYLSQARASSSDPSSDAAEDFDPVVPST